MDNANPPSPQSFTELIQTKEPVDSQTRQWQLSSIDIIEEIRHRLQGEIPVDGQRGNITRWTKISEPLANDIGINELCWFLSTYINKNIQLSWFSPDQIREMLIDFEWSLTRKLEYDWERLGIEIQNVDSIFLLIANTVWAGINRARFGGEKQFIEGTEQRRIISTEDTSQKSKGFLDKIPFIGKG